MKVRAVEPGDRDEWLRLRGDFWPDHEEDHAGEIDRFLLGELEEPAGVLVAAAGDRLVGFADAGLIRCFPKTL